MGKWLRWKLVHKDGLTFNQYRLKNRIKLKGGSDMDMSEPKSDHTWYEPVIFQGGYPCIYRHDFSVWGNGCGLFILDAKEWSVVRGES